MEWTAEAKFHLDISSEAEVLEWQYTGADPIEVIARVDLGNGTGLLSGVGGEYEMRFFVNDALITPISIIDVPTGRQTAVMIARPVPLRAMDIVSLRLSGLVGDTDVNIVATIRDSTPAKITELTGIGSVEVDHNYGGDDELAYKTSAGVGVNNAQLRVYLKTDFDNGLTDTAHVQGITSTDVNGRWIRPIMLDPETYVLYAYKQGYYGPDTKVFTVT